MKKIISLFTAMLVLSLSSCKDDKDDPIPTNSDIKGLYINEVSSSLQGWIELYNSSDKEIDVSGFVLKNSNDAGKDFKIPTGNKIAAKSYLVFNKGTHFIFDFGTSGSDKIILLDSKSAIVDEITIPKMLSSQSYGRVTNGVTGWKIFDNPTKGISNSTVIDDDPDPEPEPVILDLFINEVYSSNPDWIELYNASDEEVDISGFILRDDKGEEEQYVIPAGTKIPAKSYLVFDEEIDFEFGLSSSNGDVVALLDVRLSVVDEVTLPPMGMGKSYGRVADGADEWKIFDIPTKGLDNTAEVAPINPASFENIILTEICGEQKYVEIHNKGSVSVSLYGLFLDRNEGASDYFFKSTDVIPAGAYRLILFNSTTIVAANPGYVEGWRVSSGISDQQTISIRLITVNGDVVGSFQRGVAPWGSTDGVERQRNYSYSRMNDDSWAYAAFTPGVASGEKLLEITSPGYLADGNGNLNDVDPIEPVDPALFKDIILTEICGDQKFVEIYNKGSEDVPLVGLRLVRNEGASSYTFKASDIIPAGAYRLILFNETQIDKTNPGCVEGWTVSSGISNQQTLSIQLITVSKDVVSSFQRGAAPWGETEGVERKQEYSYSRMDNGEWSYSGPTPGAPNGESVFYILNPAYTAQ